MAQLDAGHVAEMNVEHQAADDAGRIAFEKPLCRIVPFGFVTVRVEQPFYASSHARIVFYDSHCSWQASQIQAPRKNPTQAAKRGDCEPN